MDTGPYEDVFSEEELKAMNSDTQLPGDEPGDAAPTILGAEGEGAGAGGSEAPTSDAASAPETGDADPDLAEYLKKSPEELARIALDQQKRANRLAFEQRQAGKTISDTREAARALLEQKRAEAEQRRADFEKQLETDPDAATRQLHEKLVDADVAAAEQQVQALEREAAINEAITFATQFIPDLPKRAPEMVEVAKELGYTDAEVAGVTDGRELLMMHLARTGRDAIIAGFMGPDGRPRAGQSPAAPTDPRLLQPPAPTTAGSGTGGGTPARNPSQVLADTLMLPEAEIAKMSMDDIARIAGA